MLRAVATVACGAAAGLLAASYRDAVGGSPVAEAEPQKASAKGGVKQSAAVATPPATCAPTVAASAKPTPSGEPLSQRSAISHETAQERLEIDRREQEYRITAHKQEPRDRSWATTTENAIATVLQGREDLKVALTSLECRSESCLGHIRWANKEDAYGGIYNLGKANPELPCQRHIHFEPPRDGEVVEGTIIYLCTERFGGSETIEK